MFSSNEYALRLMIMCVCRAWQGKDVTQKVLQRLAHQYSPQSRTTPRTTFPRSPPRYISLQLLIFLCQKCTKRCNCHSHKQLPCHRKSRYLGVPLWPRNCNTKTPAPLPRFLVWQRLFSCVTSLFHHRSALVVGRGWGTSPPGWLRASLI